MRLFAYRVPPLDNAVYVIADSRDDAVVIDPSFGEQEVLRTIRANGLRVLEILNSHGHFDHTYADAAIKAATKAPLAIHHLDAYRLSENASAGSAFFPMRQPRVEAERTIDEGDETRLADLRLVVLHTPGHTEGSVCFTCPRRTRSSAATPCSIRDSAGPICPAATLTRWSRACTAC